MKANSKSHTGRVGVAGTQLLFKRLGWIFREQPIEDYGIDAHVEVVENNTATGKLIALQIKSGESWFREKTSDGFVFRGDREHLEYWQQHSLPVMIVLYQDDEQIAYWQAVNSSNVQKTGIGWKLIIPFAQKIDALSLERIQEFSRKLTATNGYTILSFQDVSHGGAKRYSANILLTKEYAKPDIIEISKKITAELKAREYHRNKQVKLHWEGKEAHVIWLFLYLSLDDISSVNWICRTEWISKRLSSEFSPIKLEGENIDEETVIDWNKGYEEQANILDSYKLTKEAYLDAMICILDITKPIVEKAIQFRERFINGQLIEANYIDSMSKLEPQITDLYSQATCIGSAPTECRDLSQRFQCVMAVAHSIVLPFSEKGMEIWEGSNRNYLVDQAIKDYQKDLLRLEFELEKIH
ncbi:MAG: DUF4365 domain-containing protein [Woronichinia naegeliana WA131]|jgi:hypothetical protein|uniref:DUF4365 domain-containing protein n=1 Tax=Woronichinia naegeliana WA131 TaxID=2824559 RepID=A0A977KXX8_9CYAN|nr:MAG: DUF4365 domain-containing protein [Woronichinia naegeliana WA131]